MSVTVRALLEAFAGESQAHQKYAAFAAAAKKEGFEAVSKLFRATSAGEKIHALNHFKAMGAVEDSVSNVKTAMKGEFHEIHSMYPEMIEIASTSSHMNAKKALRSFKLAFEVEKLHYSLLEKALHALEKGEDLVFDGQRIFICPICGHLEIADAKSDIPSKCVVCNASAKTFSEVE
eukprot:gnl/Dysnectes_brevis/1082_a1210_4627.p1 GENE.gnl/Dysnectes_brevis/1082_a1210_4627~~gnl/Dysnectes_brevis/1082_a1210_4627.p1  ORF type:complete len:177 (+),score=28.97 gnl/Dysnectes_brevis/1082_a1210_4627:21-551(+)